MEGAKRKLSGPVQLKEALSLDVVVKIYDQYNSSPSLAELRFLVILLLEYVVFLRVEEFYSSRVQTSPSNNDHLSVNIPVQKNEPYCEGCTKLTSNAGKSICPVATTF